MRVRSALLKGIDEFDGEQSGLLGEVLRAGPVAVLAGVARLREEAADFFSEVQLRGVERPAGGLLEIAFGCGNVLAGLALVIRLVYG